MAWDSTFNHEAAEQLAARLREHWAARGFKIRTYIEHAETDKCGSWCVRSDMINGFPQQRVFNVSAPAA